MKIKSNHAYLLSFILIFLALYACSPQMFAQEKAGEVTVIGTDTVIIEPIPATELIIEYENTKDLISRKGKLQVSDEDLKKYDLEKDTILITVDKFLSEDLLSTL